MAAIPVPVHFDGHNINIITEDSPSTCKSRTKGVNYGKKSNNKGKKRNNHGKAQILNKRGPTANASNKKPNSSTKGDTTLVVSPVIPSDEHSPSNKENIDEVNQARLLNGSIASSNTVTQTETDPQPSHDPLPNDHSPTKPVDSGNISHNKQFTASPKIALPPPVNPHVKHNNQSTKAVPIATGAMNKRKPPRLPLAAPRQRLQQNQRPREMAGTESDDRAGALQSMASKQNEQLIASGLDPNEFGSHDDVGFDDGDSQNNNQGKDRQNLYKTELCREWSTSGWCYYNKRCSFAHGLQELRPVFRSKKWRTKRCRNWHTTGYCPYEHRCQFLHDQSPPRRISDYATANARALVAAQQRMQPLYFHYQVDCNRDETDEDDAENDMDREDKSHGKHHKNPGNRSKSNTPKNTSQMPPNASSVGPRLKRKDYRKNMAQNMKNGGPRNDPNHGNAMRDDVTMKPRAALRMVHQGKKNGMNGGNRNKQQKKKRNNNRLRTPQSNQLNAYSNMNNKPLKNKKKKQKDAVITPFNPVSATYGATPQSYELAAQQLGIYNAAAASQIPGLGQPMVPGLGALPPLPALSFQGLPPSIDPSLYLSLTPSPPQTPVVAVKEMIPLQLDNKLKKRGDGPHAAPSHISAGGLNVEVPPSLTPSPPTIPINGTGIGLDALSQKQVQMQLAKQQQTLQVLHAKVQEVAQQQAAQHAEQQATVAALLSRGVANKSATPVAPIDGGLLESLLPTDDTIAEPQTSKSVVNIQQNAMGEVASITNSVPTNKGNKGNKTTQPSSVPNKKLHGKNLPPIPPIPPPLQLQTSINSVVTGAVAAAMTPTGVTSLVPMTPTLIDSAANNQIFGYPNATKQPRANATTLTNTVPSVPVQVQPGAPPTIAAYTQPIELQSIPSIQQPVSALQTTQTTYQQQAHSYATTHTQATAYHIQPALAHHAAYGAPPMHYGAPPAQYPHIPTLQGIHMQQQVAFPQFYAPSPDFQEYYSTGYPQPRHHY
eukprot:78222_1